MSTHSNLMLTGGSSAEFNGAQPSPDDSASFDSAACSQSHRRSDLGLGNDPKYPDVKVIVTIDGPSGAGKSTMAGLIARHLGIMHLDTGAIYRSLGLYAAERGLNLQPVMLAEARVSLLQKAGQKPAESDNPAALADELALANADLKLFRASLEKEVLKILPSFHVQFVPPNREDMSAKQGVYLNGRDVTEQIRTKEVDFLASVVASFGKVREELVPIQKSFVTEYGCVTEGRDTGTSIFARAEDDKTVLVHIFLEADLEERARRRFVQKNQKEPTPDELSATAADLKRRDDRDMAREASPLRKPEDAILINSTSLTKEAVDTQIEGLIAAAVLEKRSRI